MAKRKHLKVPSEESLKEMEEGFARETSRFGGTRPPIADVVADAAMMGSPLPLADREEAARNKADAEALRDATEKGLVAEEISIDEIGAEALTRDRMEIDEEELDELCTSIAAHGLRLPIEVFRPSNPEAAGTFALISGFRRLTAFRRLSALTGGEKYRTIPAFIRTPETIAETVVAMVEENEVRSGLSQYERGRAAAISVHEGIFPTLDAAVAALFASGSKAKRSKIRSFALVHEELGDMLAFARSLSERQCLRIATALRAGGSEELRAALDAVVIDSAEDEWAAMLPAIERAENGPPDPKRGGRPKAKPVTQSEGRVPLVNGIEIEKTHGPGGYAIRFHGANVDSEMVDTVMEHIRYLLEEHG